MIESFSWISDSWLCAVADKLAIVSARIIIFFISLPVFYSIAKLRQESDENKKTAEFLNVVVATATRFCDKTG
jgi:hypothetical protein